MAARKRMLITGATGFIGSNIARFFLTRHVDITVLIRKKSSIWRIADIAKDVSIRLVDLTDKGGLKRVVSKSKPDIVVHAASYGGHPEEADSEEIFQTNLIGTRYLAEACLDHDFKIFINTGSSSEYGVKSLPMKESDFCEPITDYGACKAAATLYLASLAKREGRPIVTLRLFSPYGYYEGASRLIPSVILSCLKGKPVRVSSPNHVRDFVFIEDVLDAYKNVLGRKNTCGGEIFNIGQGEEHRVKEVVEHIIRFSGQKTRPVWGAVKGRTFEPARWQADIHKSAKLLGWRPAHTFAEGLEKSVAWFCSHENLYTERA